MNIDTLHSILHTKVYDELVRIAELLEHIPDHKLVESHQFVTEFDRAEHGGCANDLRELWGRRLNHLQWLLRHVPHDRFIVAHTPSPDSNDNLQMGPNLMLSQAQKAESVEHFFTLCEESCLKYDHALAERSKDAPES